MMHLLTLGAIGLAALSALLLVGFLVIAPRLGVAVKLGLFFAIGAMPASAALLGNVKNLETVKERRFCGSCHNMAPYTKDAADPLSTSTASFHSRNEHFGQESCYTCHRDYSMYGGVITKMDGLKHVWIYYFGEASDPIKLYRPHQNASCIRCHSTTLPRFAKVSAHKAATLEYIREGTMSCIRSGCHGPMHNVPGAAKSGEEAVR